LTPRDRIWAAIRCFGTDDNFSVAEIMVLSEQRADTVLSYMSGLERAGYVTWVGARDQKRPAARPRREFRRLWLKHDSGVDAPRVTGDGAPVEQGAGREQMWRAVKVLKEFDYRALAVAASTEKHPVSPEEAQTYCRHLKLGGYLGVTRPAAYGTKGTSARYRFLRARNTGPRAPIVTREKQVMDANTGAIVYDPRLQLQEGEHDR
jgi:hypothetical protein